MTGDPLVAHIDLSRLERNLRHFHDRAAESGVLVRPHVKGHRTVEIALRQLQYGACGIAVAQIAQARQYAKAGITDIVIAHPWPEPWRWRLMADLARDCRLSVHVETHEAISGLGAAAAAAGTVIGVRVRLGNEDDVAAVADGDLTDLAQAADAEPALRLDGVHGYQALISVEAASDREGIGRATAQYVVRVAGLLREQGLSCPVVSVSGTPTAAGAMAVPGVTEVCAGAYALQDTGMAAIGVCALDDVALSVTAVAPNAADTVLTLYPYPWQTPADYMLLTSSAPPHAPVRPPHVCSLMQQIDKVIAHGEGRLDVAWHVLNQRDEPDQAVAILQE
jgi:D-serine deaminase-like pyridoxal phosphate-dependent protein